MEPQPKNLLNTDPRTEVVMWTVVVPPLVYGVARTGFSMSRGTSLIASLIAGGLIWSGIPKSVGKAYQALASIAIPPKLINTDLTQNNVPAQ